jgi:hypothetical protein
MSQSAATKPVEDLVAKVNEEVAVGEDLGFQRSWWRFERILWTLFLLIIALDVGGMFGRGPLAHAQATSADGSLHVSYERIQRTGTPSMLSVTLQESAVRGGEATLFVSDNLVGALGSRRIIPEPATTRLGDGGFTYTFPIGKPPAIVRFELEPSGAGRFPFEISAGPRAGTVSADVWVVP